MPSPTANIQDLIALVAENCQITKKEAKVYVETVLQGIVQLATDRDKLTLREFGKFEMRHHKARVNTKPIQGSPVVIPSRELLHFTPSKLLVVEVDY